MPDDELPIPPASTLLPAVLATADGVNTGITMRWVAISATWGVIVLGIGCVLVKPQFPEGVTLVLATLTGLVGGIIGGKLGLTQPKSQPPPGG